MGTEVFSKVYQPKTLSPEFHMSIHWNGDNDIHLVGAEYYIDVLTVHQTSLIEFTGGKVFTNDIKVGDWNRLLKNIMYS